MNIVNFMRLIYKLRYPKNLVKPDWMISPKTPKNSHGATYNKKQEQNNNAARRK